MFNQDGGDIQNPNGGDTSSTGSGYDPYAQIRALYQQITNGAYTPTNADLSQWGTNIDPSYLGKIQGAIANWWTSNPSNPANQKQTQTGTTTPPPTDTTNTGGGGGNTIPTGLGGPGAPGLTDFWNTPYVPPPTTTVPNSPTPNTPYIPPTPTPGPAPTFTPPTFTPPSYTPPPAFSYQDFQAPTLQDAQNDPGYAFRLQQGQQALQTSAAAKGVLNDSGTAKALIDYGQNAATQAYDDVFNRQAQTYMMGRQNALDRYNTNYQTQYTDPYAINYQGALAAFQPQLAGFNANVNSGMAGYNAANSAANLGYSTQAAAGQHQNDMNQANAWNQYLFNYGNYTGWQDRTYNKLFQYAMA